MPSPKSDELSSSKSQNTFPPNSANFMAVRFNVGLSPGIAVIEVDSLESKIHLSPPSVTFRRTSQLPGATIVEAIPDESVNPKDTEPRPSREESVAVIPSIDSPEKSSNRVNSRFAASVVDIEMSFPALSDEEIINSRRISRTPSEVSNGAIETIHSPSGIWAFHLPSSSVV